MNTLLLKHSLLGSILNPAGTIAAQERNLIVFAALLSLVVVIPVFALTIGIAWRYREGNAGAAYAPTLAHNRAIETVWWFIPSILILILSVVAWRSSHTLDPYQPLSSTTPPLTVQVVALDWKWLFIYPQQHIATVNYLELPVNTPVNLEITADAPMNSLWIPQLGGQMYAMPGMTSQLHLMADKAGDYRGLSANISGRGFAGMNFTAKAEGQSNFSSWVDSTQKGAGQLNQQVYQELAAPSQNVAPTSYGQVGEGMYDAIINKYMVPPSEGISP